MFYVELTNFLRSCTELAATVTSYTDSLGSYPAIFGDAAPESAKMPYVVFRIEGDKIPNSIIKKSNIHIDYYDYGDSRIIADDFAKFIVDALDKTILQSENFTDIRISLMSDGYVPASDSRTIHHNTIFNSRASRSGWGKRTLT
jgi:hypothetical protein